MEKIEAQILNWYAEHYLAEKEAFNSQIQHAEIIAKEFTSGGGVFITLQVTEEALPVGNIKLLDAAQLDGPNIISPELESGASVGLALNKAGYFDYIEIWCHANDYPIDRHPEIYRLTDQKVNYVDMR